ncbi:MAG TPA: hypothetical protein VFQ79_04365 [Bryobacteraceae bacterium]|nr:hypothetical protein [Bryobacteraceae bacterium]
MPYEITGRALYPLSEILQRQEFPLAELIPQDALDTVFGGLYYTDAEAYSTSEGLHLNLRLAFEGELALSPPGLPGIALVAASGGMGWTSLRAEFVIGPEPSATLTDVPLVLRLDRSLLKPMRSRTEVDDSKPGVDLALGTVALKFSPDGLEGDLDISVSLPLSMIGDTGVLIEATNVRPILGPMNSSLPGVDASFRGVFMESVRIYLPEGLPDLAPSDLQITNCFIGTGGFTGALALNYNPVYDAATKTFSGPGSGSLFGMALGLTRLSIRLTQNTFEEAVIAGSIVLPFFDELLDIEIGLALDGGFMVAIASPGGLVTLTKPDLLELSLESIRFSLEDGVFTAGVSGSVHPLVGGIEWPTFRVEELSIDSQGHVRIQGGWLDLREQYVLSLGGFQFEISRIGFGSTEEGRRWIGFSGGLKLVDGITAGASVEGLRVAWDPNTGDISVTLNGVDVEFLVPGAVYFKGYVAMTEPAPGVTRFDGQITLDIISVGLLIEAQLVVGYDRVNDYPFFAIYLGVELPAGIPLGQTGLGLFGFAGLFALNLEPNRRPDPAQPELPWYGIQPGPSWYHAPPRVGVAELRKWVNRQGSLALGAGVTIGTVSDNGYLFAGKFLLGIIFPGPILFIEGRANILKERASLRDEPVFRALVVLDARAGTFLMGLDARYAYDDTGALIEIGGCEAFFDFHDVSAWHIYMGIDEPRERRIRAWIFERLFEANAYFMLNAERLRTGAWIGYEAHWDFGPLAVELEAWIEGNAELSFKPVYFKGSLWLHGKIAASVFGFGFGLGADARISAEVFDPLHILAELSVSVNLPWPLPDFDASIKLEWGPEPDPPLLPVPLKEVSVEHLKVTTTWPLPVTGGTILTLPDPDGDGDGFFDGTAPAPPSDTQLGPSDLSPVVPLDARPRITFGRSVHDLATIGENPSPVFPDSQPEAGWEWIGDPALNQGPARVRPALTELALECWNGTRWEPIARKATTSNPVGVRALYGSWAPVPQLPAGNVQPGSPPPTANVKLWLWSKSPYDFSRHTGGQWDEWFDHAYPDYPCLPLPPDREDCCDFSGLSAGDIPAPPWGCSAHPEIELTWAAPPRPVVRVNAGQKALCFPRGSHVTVQIGARTKRVRVSVQYEAGKETRACANFTDEAVGDGENPRRTGAFRFVVYDAAGQLLPRTRVIQVATSTGGRRGLDAGFRATIDLPASDFVELDLTRLNQPARLQAIAAGGGLIAETVMSAAIGASQVVRLERVRGQREIVRVTVTSPADRVAIHSVCYGVRPRSIVGRAIDRSGRELGAYRDVNGLIDVPGRDVVAVRLDADGGAFCVTRICVTVGLDQADRIQREEMLRHMMDELVRWEADDEVLAPWTRYRLKIVTTLDVRGFSYDAAFNSTRTITQCAYFRTEGPPGLTTYSVPIGHPQENAAAPAGASDPPQFDSGLQDLSRYVAQTVPPTVPAAGEKPPLPKPVYRAYDVGVRFNENYVETMYRLAGRDLTLAIYDNNNEPVRDHRGRLLISPNRWGRADTVDLAASEERWISHINETACLQLDRTRIARDVTLGADTHVLDPQTVYEARLLPLLMHDAFADYTAGAQARGAGATLVPTTGAGWTVRDEGTDQGPSQWIVREAGNPPSRYVEQTTNVSAGAARRSSVFAGGTLLICAADPRAGVPQADQPANWTDYRLSVYIRSLDDDIVGAGVRWSGASGYLLTLDRELNRRRLLRLVNGAATVLDESAGGYDTNRDYLASIEAAGPRIRVFLDGAPLFDVSDNRFASGSVALYCGQNAGGHFRDARVDDLRGTAPVVYRLKFTTSDFTDFRHHIHSFPSQVFRAAFPDLNDVAASIGAALPLTGATQAPQEAEARAYDTLATKALGTAARQPVALLDVTRVEQGGAALGFLVRTADPIDWRRTALSLLRAPQQPLMPDAPSIPRLIRATFATGATPQPNDESITVLLDTGMDLAGWQIQRRTLPSANAQALAAETVLFRANLDTDQGPDSIQSDSLWKPRLNNLNDFDMADSPGGIGTSMWAAGAGFLRQDGNFRVTDPPLTEPPPRLGTYAVRALAGEWRDVRFSVRLRANTGAAAGVVFRYQDVQNHYRFAFDSARNVQELTKRVNGRTSLLFRKPFNFAAGRFHALVVEALGARLRVTVDRLQIAEVFDDDLAQGAAGFYTFLQPLPRFDQVTAASLTRTLGPWTIYDHGDVRATSEWRVENRLLRQSVDLFTAPPAAATAQRSGSAAVTGDAAWTDVRITAAAQPEAAGIAGIVFRWRDSDNHYRLVFDGVNGQRWLVRRMGGVSTRLWSGAGQLGTMEVAVEAIGNRLRAWVDGAVLFDVYDDALAAGRAGVLSMDDSAGVWSAFEVRHVQPAWEDWHVFGTNEGWRAAGRRFEIRAGRSADSAAPASGAGEERLFQELASAGFQPRLRAPGVDLRLVGNDGEPGHMRRFLPDGAYVAQATARILRSADGTGMFVFVPGAGPAGAGLPSGEYRLEFTYRRDNTNADPASLVLSQASDTADETAWLDIPWPAH